MPMISVPVEKGKPMDNITLKLNSPITEDQWDAITDVDFENTEEILFTTKHKKNVRFVKAQQWIPCSERLPECDYTDVLICVHDKRKGCENDFYVIQAYTVGKHWEPTLAVDMTDFDVVAWMPLPEPYKGEEE